MQNLDHGPLIEAFPKRWTQITNLNASKIRDAAYQCGYNPGTAEELTDIIIDLKDVVYARRGLMVRQINGKDTHT